MSRWLPDLRKRLAISGFDGVARVLLTIALFEIVVISYSLWLTARIHYATPSNWEWEKGAYPVISAALNTVAVAVAAFGGLFTVAAVIAPRSLSRLWLGPRLRLELGFEPHDGCVVEWNRSFGDAILIRLAVHNVGVSAAESVEVMLDRISDPDKDDAIQFAKPARLRWADSYDLKKLEELEFHRCESVAESIIHAGTKLYVDFAFIFAPTANAFYDKLSEGTNKPHRRIGYWCIHPIYQWLPARNGLAVLTPYDHSSRMFDVKLIVSCKNAHTTTQVIRIRCGKMMQDARDFPKVRSIGSLDSKACIGMKLMEH